MFLGFINFYQQFISSYREITILLINLTQKNILFIWDDNTQQAFKDIKARVVSKPILTMPDPKQSFEIETNALDYTLRRQLSQ